LTLDPTHQQVNPYSVDDHLFKVNSHSYGQGKVSGGSSTWDAIPNPTLQETSHLPDVTSEDDTGHRAYHGTITGAASINNVLGSEANQLASNRPDLGKRRSDNLTDPASRAAHHDPSAKKRFVGKAKYLFGKASGNQDMMSSGEALRDGKVERGSK